ncbi:hypothetical protein DFH09DRAFT_1309343 [Mycena vulgaris]|nr:hypothetical protein DFH09DRAFT_1309343 [Mycena vulgaris]
MDTWTFRVARSYYLRELSTSVSIHARASLGLGLAVTQPEGLQGKSKGMATRIDDSLEPFSSPTRRSSGSSGIQGTFPFSTKISQIGKLKIQPVPNWDMGMLKRPPLGDDARTENRLKTPRLNPSSVMKAAGNRPHEPAQTRVSEYSHAIHCLQDVGDVFPQCLDLCTTYNNMNQDCNSKGNTSAIVFCECTPEFFTSQEDCYDCQVANNQTLKADLQGLIDNGVETCNSPRFNPVTTSIHPQHIVPTVVAAPAPSDSAQHKNSASELVGLSVLGVCATMLTTHTGNIPGAMPLTRFPDMEIMRTKGHQKFDSECFYLRG